MMRYTLTLAVFAVAVVAVANTIAHEYVESGAIIAGCIGWFCGRASKPGQKPFKIAEAQP